MKSLPLARILPELETGNMYHSSAVRRDLQLVQRQAPLQSVEVCDPEPVIHQQDRGDWASGYEAGLTAARSEIAAIAAEREAILAQAIENARAQWVAEESSRIVSGFEKALTVVQSEICIGLERVLTKILRDEFQARVLERFSHSVKKLLHDGDCGLITIRAPKDFCTILERQFADFSCIEIQESEETEIWVRSGYAFIESNLKLFDPFHEIGR
jgi:hypothetical protein